MARTTSTQDLARAAARAGAPQGWCCVAAEQTAGRGRQGRAWLAPAGSALLASVVLRPPSDAAVAAVPLAAGLAVAEAVERTAGVVAGLKWPNDVLVGAGKLAGVLAEVEPESPRAGRAVIVGVGVNLRVEEFPPGVAGVSLHRLTETVPSWRELLDAWLGALADRMAEAAGGVGALVPAWRQRAVGLGEVVTAVTPAGAVTGVAEDIAEEDGALLLRTGAGEVVRLLAGDVHIGDGARGALRARPLHRLS